MARTAIEVDRNLLVDAIRVAEINGPLKNRSILWNEVAKLYNENGDVDEITSGVVYLRFREWKLSVKTPKGKKGRVKGAAPVNRTARADKFSASEPITKALDALKRVTPARYKPVAERVADGSMKAAVKLKCLDCCCYDTVSIKKCPAKECSLWAFRPFQSN